MYEYTRFIAAEDSPSRRQQAGLNMVVPVPAHQMALLKTGDEPCNQPVFEAQVVLESEATSLDVSEKQLDIFVQRAVVRLQQARQPVVLLGIEIALAGLQQSVTRLLKASGLRYATTPLANTLLADCPQGLSFLGIYAGDDSVREVKDIVANSDCVLCLGAVFSCGLDALSVSQYDNMLVVDSSQTRLGSTEFGLLHLPDVITALVERFESCLGSTGSSVRQTEEIDSDTRKEPRLNKPRPEARVNYDSFFNSFNHYLVELGLEDKTTTIVGERGCLYMVDSLIMGSGKNAVGSPRRSCVISGDGGFLAISETLSAIATQKLNCVVFVLSKSVDAREPVKAKPCELTASEFIPFEVSPIEFSPLDVTPLDVAPQWNYRALTEAWGVEYLQADSHGQLAQCLETVLGDIDRPYLVEIRLDNHGITSGLAAARRQR